MIFSGEITKITYTGTGFSVVKALDHETGEEITAAGKIYNPKIGLIIKAEGEFTLHPKFGRQFTVSTCQMSVMRTPAAVIRYLSSSCISGVGLVLAKRIVDKFGPMVIETIIEKNPERLTEVPGISSAKAMAIAKSHSENFVFQELAAFDLTQSQMFKLYEQYKEKAVEILKKDPYQAIYDIEGFGFKTVDAIAIKNGVSRDDPKRIAAAITYVLTDIGNQGHCWCHIENMMTLVKSAIADVEDEKIAVQLVKEFTNGHVIRDGERIYAQSLYYAEYNTARGIAEMAKASQKLVAENKLPVTKRQIDNAIYEIEDENGFEFETLQKQAVNTALQNRISIITGGPGTGKTTIITAIIQGWMKQFKPLEDPEDHVILCAPTGKAARRMSEVTGVYAETIQRILTNRKRSEDDSECKLIILDEASMMDIKLANQLITFAKEKHYLVLVGDVDQLPPIGPGHFFRDCLQSPFVPSTKLELSHRQSGRIAMNAKRINDGLGMHALCLDDPDSFRFTPAGKEDVQKVVIEKYINLLNSGYSITDICCIVPIRKAGRSQTSADDLNQIIRERVNPDRFGRYSKTPKGLRLGDRVMNTENDYDNEVFNGDCGIVTSIDSESETVTVRMDDGRSVDFNKTRANFLILAYAMTVHKSQGSEYKAVVIAHSMEHYYMLQRNLLYTAVTRAKLEVDLVGEAEAINLAVSRIPSLERNTCLRERIKTFMLK